MSDIILKHYCLKNLFYVSIQFVCVHLDHESFDKQFVVNWVVHVVTVDRVIGEDGWMW